MSGDIGLSGDDTIVFYSKKMTEAKMIVLAHKGIKLNYDSKYDINNVKSLNNK
tara:strand:+ start:2163 stop:2321 length:159 start_codon:yes stop_codon:yes gene_type:complete